MAGLFERRPKIAVVEDFAVLGNPERPRFVGHGLMAARDINDAEAAMSEVGPLVVVRTGIVRPAVAEGIRHARERSFRTRSGPSGNESSDPAHGFSVAANCAAVGKTDTINPRWGATMYRATRSRKVVRTVENTWSRLDECKVGRTPWSAADAHVGLLWYLSSLR